MIYETDLRPAGRQSTAFDFVPSLVRALVTPDGATHVLLVLPPGREFGTTQATSPQVLYRVVDPDGKVTTKAGPRVGSDDLSRASLVRAADGHPALVETDATDRGRFVLVHTTDGSTWQELAFLRAHRPPGDAAATWGDGQVRVLGPRELVVQHGGYLTRFDGAAWSPLPRPDDAADLRLGQADETRLRVYWVTKDGTVRTGTFDRGTWAFSGATASLRRGVGAHFGPQWSHSGTVDTFTLALDETSSGTNTAGEVQVLRHGAGAFHLAEHRQRYASGPQWFEGLLTLGHPYRGLVLSNGTLQATWQGKVTAPLGPLTNAVAVTCASACTVHEGAPIGEEPGCPVCTPRSLKLAAWSPTPDVDGLAVVLLDTRQDATARLYLRQVAFPLSDAAYVAPVATTAFPGDDGTQDNQGTADGLAHVEGAVFKPGVSDHSGITVTLNGHETLVTSPDGTVAFAGIPPGPATVTASAAGFRPLTLTLDAHAPGVMRLSGMLLRQNVTELPLDPDAETWVGQSGTLQLDGGVLTQSSLWPTPARTVLATGVVDVRPDLPAWSTATHLGFTFGAPTLQVPATVRLASLRTIFGGAAFPDGAWDGVTAVDWRTLAANPAPLLLAGVADVQPHGANCGFLWAWEVPAVGQTRVATTTTCQAGAAIRPESRAATNTPALVDLQTETFGSTHDALGLSGVGCGQAGGFQAACTAHLLGWQPPSAVVDTVLATDALFATLQLDASGTTPRVAWVSRSAGGASLNSAAAGSTTGVVAQAGLALPATWAPGETPVVALERSSTLLVRTTDGLYESTGAAGDFRLVLPRVVKVQRAPRDPNQPLALGHAVAWQAPQGHADCAAGCTLWHLIAGQAPVALPHPGNGGEAIDHLGLFSDAATFEGPDGPCQGVERQTWTGAPQPLGAGHLLPDRRTQGRVFGALHQAPAPQPVVFELPRRTGVVLPQ